MLYRDPIWKLYFLKFENCMWIQCTAATCGENWYKIWSLGLWHKAVWRLKPILEVSSPLCVWELERVCSQTQLCQLRCLMSVLDSYMFWPLLAIFRLSLRELKVLLYNVRACDGEISTVFNAMECSARWGLVASIEIEVGVKRRVEISPSRVRTLYSRTLHSLKDNLKMASRGQNM